MNEKEQQILDEYLSKEFKKIANNFEFKLKQIMEFTDDAEAIHILNLTLNVIDQRFKK